MKKFVLPLVAAVVMVLTATSCAKEEIVSFESMNTVWDEFTVTNDMWGVDPSTGDLVCSQQWDVLTRGVLECGNIQVYLYEGTRQVPLPYSYPVTFQVTDSTGTHDYVQPLTVRFDVEEGVVSFLVTDYPIWFNDLLTDPRDLLTMRFRAVCTYPVDYVLHTN